MAWIYGIERISTGVCVYVGQTVCTVERRFARHIRTAEAGSRMTLYRFMRSVGIEDFRPVRLEQCHVSALNDLERWWIASKQTMVQFGGCNVMPGGEQNRKLPAKDGSKRKRKRRRKRCPAYLDQFGIQRKGRRAA